MAAKGGTLRVRARVELVKQLHVTDVVHVDALFEDNDEPPAVELDREDRGRERELADDRLSLQTRSISLYAIDVCKRKSRTFVLTICSRLVLELGLSPAPTSATSEVQNSISTIEVAPSPTQEKKRGGEVSNWSALDMRQCGTGGGPP